jgi:hypothetical protein
MMKKVVALLLAVCLLLSFAGCSTPKVAITVDGREYPTGEYLAYLLDAFQNAYYNGGLYYYAQYGDIWEQKMTHNEKEVKLDEYLKLQTVDTIIRQKALENLMAKEGVKPSAKLTEDAQKMVDEADEAVLLSYGVNKQHYEDMCMAYYRNEMSLFLSRYGEGGAKEVAEKDIRAYFDENYLSFKGISIQMVDSEQKEFSAAKQKETKETLQKYLDLYNKNGDFNKVIAQYNYDTSTASDKKVETLTDEDTRQDIDAGSYGDEDFTNALKKVPEGKAQIITYSAGGTTLTAALVLRLDPESGEKGKTWYKDSKESILLSLKHDEFDKEIKEYAKTLPYQLNDRAYKMCDPKSFMQ